MRCFLLAFVLISGLVQADEASVAQDLARVLSPLFERAEQVDDLWTAYKPSQRALGVYRPGQGVLVRHCVGDTPAGWLRLAELVNRPELGPCALFRSEVAGLGEASFHIQQDLGEFSASLIREEEALAMLIHEDFHGFQRAWADRERSSTLRRLDESGDSATLRASLQREAELLNAALDQLDSDAWRELLARWLALRLARDAAQPERFVEVARLNEVIEGTAMWVGERAEMHLLDARDDRRRLNSIQQELSASTRSISNQMFYAYYAHGGMLAALLDGVSDDRDWQQRLEQGESFPELVIDLLDLDQERLLQLADDERASRAWRRAERSHGRSLARFQREQERSATMFAWVLEFHVPLEAAARMTPNISFSSDSATQDDEGRLIIHHARNFQFTLAETVIEVDRQPVVVDSADDQDGRSHHVVAVPLRQPLNSRHLTRDGDFVELTRFSDRRARIELRSETPVLIRQVEVGQ
jgi:hypothetical protein